MTSSFKIRDFHSFATPRLYGVPLIICKDSKKTNKEIDLQASIWLLLTDRLFVPKFKNKVSIFTLQNIFPCDHKRSIQC